MRNIEHEHENDEMNTRVNRNENLLEMIANITFEKRNIWHLHFS